MVILKACKKKKCDFQPYAVFNYMFKKYYCGLTFPSTCKWSSIDKVYFPNPNDKKKTNYLKWWWLGSIWQRSWRREMINSFDCLESFQAKVQGKGTQTESGSLPELKRLNLERWRWLAFTGQTIGEEGAIHREYSRDLQRVPLEASAELWSAYMHEKNYWRPRKDHQKESGWTTPKAYTGLGIVWFPEPELKDP